MNVAEVIEKLKVVPVIKLDDANDERLLWRAACRWRKSLSARKRRRRPSEG